MSVALRWLTGLLLFGMAAPLPAQNVGLTTRIPLYIFNVGREGHAEFKVGIRLKVRAVSSQRETPWRMYEFDTGGTGFLAFPYQSDRPNSPGAYTIDYGSGNQLTGEARETVVTFETLGPLPPRSIRTGLVLITGAAGKKEEDSLNAWQKLLPGTPPLETYFYGDFGMALDTLKPSAGNASRSSNLYAVLPQLIGRGGAGFVVSLGPRPADNARAGTYGEVGRGWVQIGLMPREKRPSAWSSTVTMTPPSGLRYPGSRLPVYTEILSEGRLGITGLGPLAAGIVYDTGAPNVEIHPVGRDAGEGAEIEAALAGPDAVRVLLEGTPRSPGGSGVVLDFSAGNEGGADKVKISTENVIASPGLYVNTGIDAFFGREVGFNLTDGFVGFRAPAEDGQR